MAKILVIEDDPVNAELFDLVLSRMAHHSVTVTEDGDFALEQYNSGAVDAVIMDVSLSNTFLASVAVDGLRLSKAMKAGPNGALIPILLATAHAMRDDMENFLIASAADDYISKPIVDFGKLVDAVEHLLEKSRQHRALISSL